MPFHTGRIEWRVDTLIGLAILAMLGYTYSHAIVKQIRISATSGDIREAAFEAKMEQSIAAQDLILAKIVSLKEDQANVAKLQEETGKRAKALMIELEKLEKARR
jgi:hypothetical protein